MVRIYLNTVSGDFSWLDSAAAGFAVNAALGGLSATSDGGDIVNSAGVSSAGAGAVMLALHQPRVCSSRQQKLRY